MYYLLDTHVCICALADQTKLSNRVKEILENGENGLPKTSAFGSVIWQSA